MGYRRHWIIAGLLIGVALLVSTLVWAGTGGVQAWMDDNTGRLHPILSGVPLILSPEVDQDIQITTSGSGAVVINGSPYPPIITPQQSFDNVPSGNATIGGITAAKKLIFEGDLAGGSRFELYESAGQMFFECKQDDDSACNHIFELATNRSFAIQSTSIANALRVIEAEPQTVDLIERTGNPATPASTRWKLFFKSDGLNIIDDAGAVSLLNLTDSSASTLTNKTLNAESTGNLITLPRRLWIPAAGCNNATAGPVWDLPTTSPAVASCVTGTNTQKGVLDFADATNLSAQYTYKLPSTWTGDIEVAGKWFSSTASTANMVWQVQASCVADGETDDPAWDADILAITDAGKGTTLQVNDFTGTLSTATHLSTCAAGELLHLKLFRDSAHASDTFAGTARLIGVELTVREAM